MVASAKAVGARCGGCPFQLRVRSVAAAADLDAQALAGAELDVGITDRDPSSHDAVRCRRRLPARRSWAAAGKDPHNRVGEADP